MADLNALMDEVRERLVERRLEVAVQWERSTAVPIDGRLALRLGEVRARFELVVTESVRVPQLLAAMENRRGFVVARWISPAVGRRLSEAGIAWADTCGNMAVLFGSSPGGLVVMEVSGRPRPRVEVASDDSPAVRMVQLLTPANARVLQVLVDDPAAGALSVRALAAAAGVSVGQAHTAVTLMAAAGYHRDRLTADQVAALTTLLGVTR